MAQILKDENRDKIINETIKIVSIIGIDKVSMRDIASKCNMTVGNLYRYFDSKQSLMGVIYEPFINKLDYILKKYTNESVSIFNEDFKEIKYEQVNEILDKLSADLVKMNNYNHLELKICMRNKKVNAMLKDWFSNLLFNLSKQWNANNITIIYCEALASATFEGVNYLFEQNLSEKELNMELNRFLKGFIGLLKTTEEN